jgi:hypothetical protein
MKSWWSLNAAEWEAMKRLEFEPELRDRGKRHKGLSFSTLFKLLASILTQNGSWEQKTHFRSSRIPSSASLWLIRLQYRIYFNPQFHVDHKWEGLQVKVSLLNPIYLFDCSCFLSFSLFFHRSTRFHFALLHRFHLDQYDQVQRIDVSENMRSTAAMHLTIKPNR